MACFFMARIFISAPNAQIWQELQDIRHLDWIFEDATTDELQKFAAFQQSLDASLDALAVDHAQLFTGPAELKAAPWASVYMDQDQAVFGDETSHVRKFYDKYQMEVENKFKEPDDHLALEFQFIALILQHLELVDDAQSRQYILKDIHDFLHEHFLPWAPVCLDAVRQHAQTDFYKYAAILALFTIERLQKL